MRQVTRTISTLGLILVVGTTMMSAQGARPRVGLQVFDDIRFGGRSVIFERDTPDLRASGLENKISSLRVAPGESWEVCDGRNYGGRCEVFSGDDPDLRARGWSDRISSIRQVRGVAHVGGGLQLFAGTGYSGQRVVLDGPTADFQRINFNDRALSARVPRGEAWELCVNADYDDCRVIDGDVPDLGRMGLARLASSARPHAMGRHAESVVPRQLPHIVFYDGIGFKGRSASVDGEAPTLSFFNDRAGSIEVFGGRWEICDRTRYGGKCVTISDNVRDLRTLGLNDRISSVRPR